MTSDAVSGSENFPHTDSVHLNIVREPELHDEQLRMLAGFLERITFDAQQAHGEVLINPDYLVPVLEKGALSPAQINWLGERIFEAETSLLDPALDDFRKRRLGRHVVIRTLSWFGESMVSLEDPVSARSTERVLKSWGGIAGRRAARKVRSRIFSTTPRA